MEAYSKEDGKHLLTTEEVARWLGVAPRTVCLWAECGELPALKIGRQWRFRRGELDHWLEVRGRVLNGQRKE